MTNIYKAYIYNMYNFVLFTHVCMCMMEPVIIYGQTVALDRYHYLHFKNMNRQSYFDPREVIGCDMGGASE